MHTHKKNQKRVLPVVFTSLLLVFVAIAAVLIIPKLISERKEMGKTAVITEPEPEETPEPIDLRSYNISLPKGRNDAQSSFIESLKQTLIDEFSKKYDGSEPATLTIDFEEGTSEELLSFIIKVNDGERFSETSWCLDSEGNNIAPQDLWGDDWEKYVLDFINITAFTPDSGFDDNNVLILYHDISDAISVQSDPFSHYLMNDDGSVEFSIHPEAILEEAVYTPCTEACPFFQAVSSSSMPESVPDSEDYSDGNDPADINGLLNGSMIPDEQSAETPSPESNDATILSSEAETIVSDVRLPVPYYDESGNLIVSVNDQIFSGDFYNTRRLYPQKPMVAITFDDGPSSVTTPEILEVLQENGAVATFFEIGRKVVNAPEVLQMELKAGCQIGSHSYNHINLLESGWDGVVYDKSLADQAFVSAIGFVPNIYRPPEGVTGNGLIAYSEPFIGWSLDTLDWLSKNPSKIVNYIQTRASLDGQVILMHSIYETTVTAVREIVPWIKEQGYQMVTIDELFKYFYEIEPESHYYYADVKYWTGIRPASPENNTADESTTEIPA